MSDERTDGLVARLAGLSDRIESGTDRREFLRTVASGGYALGMASFLGAEDFLAADDGEVPVVTALVRSDPDDPFSLEERIKYVPAKWYAAVTKAIELNELLASVAFTGYLGSAVVPGSYDSETATVSVGISNEGDSLRDLFRDLAEGISIDAETILEIEDFSESPEPANPRFASAFDVTDGRAPSGVVCETASSMATLSPAIYDPDSARRFFATAEHAYEGVEEPLDEGLMLPVDDAETIDLGTVSVAYPTEDVALIEPDGRFEPTSEIAAPRPVRVRGQLTRFGLADLVARGEELEKVGALTGHTTGRVQGFDAVTCFTDEFCRRGQIRWGGEMDLTDGDSGSVSYYDHPDLPEGEVLVAGFNNARTWWPGQSYVWGVSAYKLTEERGVHF
ncbi:hypothetical protein [Halopiger goleimassiliensis]|uniref:hypothetical protein n=1 Tax=Halopiger goleimassiliensis TaxID=1293048 RepID=UPI0006776C55|nr:hypothetical protein [Halopiger goleimassiliensis]